jgi:hypothetical protein
MGNLEGGDSWETDEEGLWERSVSLFMADGTRREGNFTGDPDGCVKKGFGDGHLCSYVRRGPWNERSAKGSSSEDSFSEDSEGYAKEGSGKGASVSIGYQLGDHASGVVGGSCFTEDFERKVSFF